MVVPVKESMQRQKLRFVVLCRARAVCVDVVDIVRGKSRIHDSAADSQHLPLALGVGSGYVVSVGGNSAAQYFAVYFSAASLCVLVALDYQNAGALAERDSA